MPCGQGLQLKNVKCLILKKKTFSRKDHNFRKLKKWKREYTYTQIHRLTDIHGLFTASCKFACKSIFYVIHWKHIREEQ